ncbi:chitobiase/beta-hexosaminidase C-terminal domain-containing protein [Acetobacterium sp.]|uniref:chitobiase/beta-hexosaminidase C-terminal domain-containing protein n=1 Tax=Acetobacterium sp. TaxID=1872094 RepID=UPI003594691C
MKNPNNKNENTARQTEKISKPELEHQTDLLIEDKKYSSLIPNDCAEKTEVLADFDDNTPKQNQADHENESSLETNLSDTDNPLLNEICENYSLNSSFSDEETHDSEEEPTESLMNEVTLKSNKNKQCYLILGTGIVICIIAALAFFIPAQMKATEINKCLDLGEQYLEEGKYEEAILAFDEVIAIEPKLVAAYEGKGSANIGLKNFTEAEVQLETAKSIEYTDNGKALMSDVYINTERKDLAKSLLDELINHNPEETRVIVYVSKLYTQLNEYAKVIELLEKKIATTTDQEELKIIYDALINAFVKAGKTESEIIALLERAAKATGDQSYLDKKASYIVKKPSFSLTPGEYQGIQSLEIIKGSSTDKAYYTIDGSEPSIASTEYTAPIALQAGEITVKMMEVNEAGVKCPVAEGKYIIKQNKLTNGEFIDKLSGVWYRYADQDCILNITNTELRFWVKYSPGWGSYEILSTTEKGGTIRIADYKVEGVKQVPVEYEFDFGTPGDNKISIRLLTGDVANSDAWFEYTAAQDIGNNRYQLPSDFKSPYVNNGIVTIQ